MGSFYLVNLILAIVAMSYDDCRKQDQENAEEELAVSHSDRRPTIRDLKLENPKKSWTFWGCYCNSQHITDSDNILCGEKAGGDSKVPLLELRHPSNTSQNI